MFSFEGYSGSDSIHIETHKNDELISKTSTLTTAFRNKKFTNILDDLNIIYKCIEDNTDDLEELEKFILYISERKDKDWFLNNYNSIIKKYIDILMNNYCNNVDFKVFANNKKKTKSSIFIEHEEIIEIIKMILVTKLCFGIVLTEIEKKDFDLLHNIIKSAGLTDNTLTKIYNIINGQVKRTSLTNTYLWNLYQYEFGTDNIAFIFNIFNELILKDCINFKIKEGNSPISYFISNVKYRIQWWINNHFGNIRQLGVDNQTFDSVFNNTVKYKPNERIISAYEEVTYKRFVDRITKFIFGYDINKDDLNTLIKLRETHKLSTISKYISSYIISYVFEFDFENVLNLSLLNENISLRFLLIIKVLFTQLKNQINLPLHEINNFLASCNLFIPKNVKYDNFFVGKDELIINSDETSILVDFLNNKLFKYSEKEILSYVFDKINKNLYIRKNVIMPFFKVNVKNKKILCEDKHIRILILDVFRNILLDNIFVNYDDLSDLNLILMNLKKYA